MLEDGTECKVITGIDDHSRFCVIAKLVPRATARPGARPSWRRSAATASPNRS